MEIEKGINGWRIKQGSRIFNLKVFNNQYEAFAFLRENRQLVESNLK